MKLRDNISTLAIKGGKKRVNEDILPFNSIGTEEKEAIGDFLEQKTPLSGFHGSAQPTFFGGVEVRRFEEEWSGIFGSRFVVSVNSATSGLIAAMGAIGVEPGDEVIVPPYTMSASAIAPIIYGGVPVFVDLEDDFFCLDIQKVIEAITTRTKAILAVNLWGHPSELFDLRKIADARGIYLIEDNSQAIYAKQKGKFTGTVGHIGVYSMNVHKHIQAGEGGVCVTEDSGLAERLQLIRNHGENVTEWLNVKDLTNIIGFNFRQTEIGAVISRIQLKKIQKQVERCRSVSERLSEGLRDLKGIIVPKVREDSTHSYFMWSVRFLQDEVGCSRESFFDALRHEGVPVAQGYVPPIYRLPIFKNKIAIGSKGFPFNLSNQDYGNGICPVTERLFEKEIIQYQPVAWDPTESQIDEMIEAFRKVHAHANQLI